MVKIIKNFWDNQEKNDKILIISFTLIIVGIVILKLRGYF